MAEETAMDAVANWLKNFGSSFPHITFSLDSLPTPVVFDIQSTPYVESLMFLGILPLMYLLLFMIILMIYYCCVGFSLKIKNDEKQSCCSASVGFYITSAILIMLTSLCALYGAVMLCAPAQEQIQTSLDNLNPEVLQNDMKSIPKLIQNVTKLMNKIESNVLDELSDAQADADTFRDATAQFRDVFQNENPFPAINGTAQMATMNEYMDTVETWRYWSSIGLFALFAVIAILSMFGVCFKSKGMLIGMTCISFFTLVLCDLSLSVQLSVGVALSDFCMDPAKAQKNILDMPNCEDVNDIEGLKELRNNADSISNIMSALIDVQTGAQNKDWNDFRDNMDRLSAEAENFQSLLDCSYVTEEYNKIAGKYFSIKYI